mgnify:CR=1 FL=1
MKKQLLLGVAALSLIAANAYAVEDTTKEPGASDKPAVASAEKGEHKEAHKHGHHHKAKKDKASEEKSEDSSKEEPAKVEMLKEGR